VAGELHDQVIDQTYWLVHFRAGSLTADPLDGGTTGGDRQTMGSVRYTCFAFAALAFAAACDDSTIPLGELDDVGVDWLEGRWTDSAVELRIVGRGGCLGPQRIDLEIQPARDGWANLIVLPRPARRPSGVCTSQLLDTTVLLSPRDLPASLTVWATYPYQPGVRRFFSLFRGSLPRWSGAGEVRIDTLADGCFVIRPSPPYAHLVYALWRGGLEVEPGHIVFLRGEFGRAGCGGLRGLEVPVISRTTF
jgi:hypothetical protein